MNISKKIFLPGLLATALLTACSGTPSTPMADPTHTMEAVLPTVVSIQTASPVPVSPTPLVFADPSIPMSERLVHYYFVSPAERPLPEGSVVVMADTYILAPTAIDLTYSDNTADDLRSALEAALKDGRNGWVGNELEITTVAFDNGRADVALQGEYFGVGDVTLIAASTQILLTVFANVHVESAVITLNGDTIANMGISNSMNAKPADYVFTREEVEAYINENIHTQ